MDVFYIKNKREQFGQCNICHEERSLSWDHIPPQGGIRVTSVEMQSIFRVMISNNTNFKIQESQNGLKFRTICKQCNELLGRMYDPAINDFAIGVGRYLTSSLKFPSVVYYNVKPNLICRGILAHLVAAKIDSHPSIFDEKVCDFILDESRTIPDDIFIYYWLFPYNFIFVIRDIIMPAIRGNFSGQIFCHLLKYFPIAYLVGNKPRYEGLLELTQYRKHGLDYEIEIPINLKKAEHPQWPEMPDRGNILVGGQSLLDSIMAQPRIKKQKLK
jgi:hypothetical protein